ncbi:MAG: hypothetical protein ACE5F6_12280 [Anaerolineae bacterium]
MENLLSNGHDGPGKTQVNGEHSAEELRSLVAASIEQQMWKLYLLVGIVIAESALIVLGNAPRMSAWLLALLAVGVGQALLMPATVGWLGGLAVVVLWVLLRRATGVWIHAEWVQGILEIIGVGMSVSLAVRFRQDWQEQQHELEELRALRNVLVAGEVGTGLLPREVAELRILEEVDRAKLFRRPLGLLLIEIEHLPELAAADAVDFAEVYQAVTRQLTSSSLVHDIPFRAGPDRVGLILPERDWDRLYDDAELIASRLKGATFLGREERPQPVLEYVRLHFGLGTYQGEVDAEVDLMRAAQDSLNISRDLAALGEAPLSAYAMPAAPVVEPKLILGDTEE